MNPTIIARNIARTFIRKSNGETEGPSPSPGPPSPGPPSSPPSGATADSGTAAQPQYSPAPPPSTPSVIGKTDSGYDIHEGHLNIPDNPSFSSSGKKISLEERAKNHNQDLFSDQEHARDISDWMNRREREIYNTNNNEIKRRRDQARTAFLEEVPYPQVSEYMSGGNFDRDAHDRALEKYREKNRRKKDAYDREREEIEQLHNQTAEETRRHKNAEHRINQWMSTDYDIRNREREEPGIRSNMRKIFEEEQRRRRGDREKSEALERERAVNPWRQEVEEGLFERSMRKFRGVGFGIVLKK